MDGKWMVASIIGLFMMGRVKRILIIINNVVIIIISINIIINIYFFL